MNRCPVRHGWLRNRRGFPGHEALGLSANYSTRMVCGCPLARLMHRRLSRKYGLQIPRGTRIGYGLYIGHGIGIVINPGTVIGNNCNLSQFLTIGSNHNTPAVIADEVYIGPSVCIVEDVHIGRGATIGAGAVVVKDVPEGATVAGVPARVLNCDHPGRYIGRKWPHC